MRFPIQRGGFLDAISDSAWWVPGCTTRARAGKTRERKMIQMIQMIQMIVFSSFVFRIRAARFGPRVACSGTRSAPPAGTNPGTMGSWMRCPSPRGGFLDALPDLAWWVPGCATRARAGKNPGTENDSSSRKTVISEEAIHVQLSALGSWMCYPIPVAGKGMRYPRPGVGPPRKGPSPAVGFKSH
jgi:hypothetical protein